MTAREAQCGAEASESAQLALALPPAPRRTRKRSVGRPRIHRPGEEPHRVRARITRHQPVHVVLRTTWAARELNTLRLQITPRYETRRRVESRLDVRRQGSGADLIALTFDDPDPLRAAAVLERMLAEYLDFARRAARGDAGTTAAELRRQVGEQQSRLTAAEESLRRYQEATGLVLPTEQGAAQVKRYAVLRGALDRFLCFPPLRCEGRAVD